MQFTSLYKKWIAYINRRRKEKLYRSISKEIKDRRKTEAQLNTDRIEFEIKRHLKSSIVGYSPYWKKQKIKDDMGDITEVVSSLMVDYRIDSINNLYNNILEISKNLYEKFSAIEGKNLVIYHEISKGKVIHHKLTLIKTIKYVTEVFLQLYECELLPELQDGGYALLKTIAEYTAFMSFFEDEKYMKVIEEGKQRIIDKFGCVPKEIGKMIQQDFFVNVVLDMK